MVTIKKLLSFFTCQHQVTYFPTTYINFQILYKSTNLSQDQFVTFSENREHNIDSIQAVNHFLLVITGTFNTKTQNLYNCSKTNFEGSKFDGLTNSFGLQQ